MVKKQQYQAYAAATQTVAKTRQVVMLYDGTIRFLQQAKEAIREKRIEDRYKLLIKASEVINGLQGCLDFENGGDIARLLYNFYASIDSRIFSIHRTASIEACDAIIADLRQMRDVWQEIDQSTLDNNQASTAEPAQPPVPPEDQGPANITLSA